jgi:hypothetical protein
MLHAQESLVGTYSGSYTSGGGVGSPRPIGVELTVASEDNGSVKGTVKISRQTNRGTHPCSGEYQMEGKLTGGKLVMKSAGKSGSADDCSFSFNGVKEGNKLVGTTGTAGTGSPLTLSK